MSDPCAPRSYEQQLADFEALRAGRGPASPQLTVEQRLTNIEAILKRLEAAILRGHPA